MLSGTEKQPFKLREQLAIDSSSPFYQILTSLPYAEKIQDLWLLPANLGDSITNCINHIYSHVTQRGAGNEGSDKFFHHVGATALWEIYHNRKIKGKDHSKKAAGIYNQILKCLKEIENALNAQKLHQNQIEILNNFHAELVSHQNTLALVFNQLSNSKKEHIEKYANIGIHELIPIPITPRKKNRVQHLHPLPLENTPKKLSQNDAKSIVALQATEPPSILISNHKKRAQKHLSFDDDKMFPPKQKNKPRQNPLSDNKTSSLLSIVKDSKQVETLTLMFHAAKDNALPTPILPTAIAEKKKRKRKRKPKFNKSSAL